MKKLLQVHIDRYKYIGKKNVKNCNSSINKF